MRNTYQSEGFRESSQKVLLSAQSREPKNQGNEHVQERVQARLKTIKLYCPSPLFLFFVVSRNIMLSMFHHNVKIWQCNNYKCVRHVQVILLIVKFAENLEYTKENRNESYIYFHHPQVTSVNKYIGGFPSSFLGFH